MALPAVRRQKIRKFGFPNDSSKYTVASGRSDPLKSQPAKAPTFALLLSSVSQAKMPTWHFVYSFQERASYDYSIASQFISSGWRFHGAARFLPTEWLVQALMGQRSE
jgi:hypothetical protein